MNDYLSISIEPDINRMAESSLEISHDDDYEENSFEIEWRIRKLKKQMLEKAQIEGEYSFDYKLRILRGVRIVNDILLIGNVAYPVLFSVSYSWESLEIFAATFATRLATSYYEQKWTAEYLETKRFNYP